MATGRPYLMAAAWAVVVVLLVVLLLRVDLMGRQVAYLCNEAVPTPAYLGAPSNWLGPQSPCGGEPARFVPVP